MTLTAALGVYFILWWLVLFAVLPWGVRSQHEEGVMEAGTDPGAPLQPFLLRKAIVTTLISAVIFGVGYFVWRAGWIPLDRLPMPFPTR